MKRITFDHAATTPLDPRVAAAMRPYEAEIFGNPSSAHELHGPKGVDALYVRSEDERNLECLLQSLPSCPA